MAIFKDENASPTLLGVEAFTCSDLPLHFHDPTTGDYHALREFIAFCKNASTAHPETRRMYDHVWVHLFPSPPTPAPTSPPPPSTPTVLPTTNNFYYDLSAHFEPINTVTSNARSVTPSAFQATLPYNNLFQMVELAPNTMSFPPASPIDPGELSAACWMFALWFLRRELRYHHMFKSLYGTTTSTGYVVANREPFLLKYVKRAITYENRVLRYFDNPTYSKNEPIGFYATHPSYDQNIDNALCHTDVKLARTDFSSQDRSWLYRIRELIIPPINSKTSSVFHFPKYDTSDYDRAPNPNNAFGRLNTSYNCGKKIIETFYQYKDWAASRIANCLYQKILNPTPGPTDPEIHPPLGTMMASGDGSFTTGLFNNLEHHVLSDSSSGGDESTGASLFSYKFPDSIPNPFNWKPEKTREILFAPIGSNNVDIIHMELFGIDRLPPTFVCLTIKASSGDHRCLFFSARRKTPAPDTTRPLQPIELATWSTISGTQLFAPPYNDPSNPPNLKDHKGRELAPHPSGFPTEASSYLQFATVGSNINFHIGSVTSGPWVGTWNTVTKNFILAPDYSDAEVLVQLKAAFIYNASDKWDECNLLATRTEDNASSSSKYLFKHEFGGDEFHLKTNAEKLAFPIDDPSTTTVNEHTQFEGLIDNIIDGLEARIPIVNLRGQYVGVYDGIFLVRNQAFEFEVPPSTEPQLLLANETQAQFDATVRASNIELSSSSAFLMITIESFCDRQRSKLHTKIHSDDRTTLNRFTPTNTVTNSFDTSPNPAQIPCYNPVLTGLRSFGMLETLIYRLNTRITARAALPATDPDHLTTTQVSNITPKVTSMEDIATCTIYSVPATQIELTWSYYVRFRDSNP